MANKRKTVKPGKVQKIIRPVHQDDVEKAEIGVHGADELYREIRVENTLHDEKGKPVKLKEGAAVDVVIEADADATLPKNATLPKKAAWPHKANKD